MADDANLKLMKNDKFKTFPDYLRPFIPSGKSEEFIDNRLKILNRAYKELNFPLHYREALLEDFPPNIIKKVSPRQKKIESRYIIGPPGTGKTHLIYALYKRYMEMSLIENMTSTNCVYIQVPKFLSLLRSTYGRPEAPPEIKILEDFTRGDYFFIDDLGAEKTTEWTISTLYLLIDSLYINNKIVFISSNLSLNEISERFDERIASRLRGMCKILNLEGDDRR